MFGSNSSSQVFGIEPIFLIVIMVALFGSYWAIDYLRYWSSYYHKTGKKLSSWFMGPPKPAWLDRAGSQGVPPGLTENDRLELEGAWRRSNRLFWIGVALALVVGIGSIPSVLSG